MESSDILALACLIAVAIVSTKKIVTLSAHDRLPHGVSLVFGAALGVGGSIAISAVLQEPSLWGNWIVGLIAGLALVELGGPALAAAKRLVRK